MSHVGQHGHGDYSHMIKTSVPAEPKEYEALMNELVGVCGAGDLKVYSKRTPEQYDDFMESLREYQSRL